MSRSAVDVLHDARRTLEELDARTVIEAGARFIERLNYAAARSWGRRVEPHLVAARERDAAAWALSLAELDLGVVLPAVTWFVPADGSDYVLTGDETGFISHERAFVGLSIASPPALWLQAERGAAATARTALHEARHHWQFGRPDLAACAADELEEDAAAYAALIVAVLRLAPEC